MDSNGKPLTITEHIEKFRTDAEKVWVELIEVFMKEEEKGVGENVLNSNS